MLLKHLFVSPPLLITKVTLLSGVTSNVMTFVEMKLCQEKLCKFEFDVG